MKVYLKTFGCRANQYDTELVRALALDSGAEIVECADDADYAVFNSCAVTSEAEADLRQAVRRAARKNPRLKSVVMGCASGRELRGGNPRGGASVNSIRALPSVEQIVPGADVDAVAAALGFAVGARPARQSGARALLRIQDGCDEHCTFCATTIARGENQSRAIEDVVREATVLADSHPEIVLTGVHIGTYGLDIGARLSELVERLVTAVPAVRFRLSSLEATEVDDRLAALFTHPRQLAPYLHAPLQSGSDRVLKRMGRHWYAAATYASAVERVVSRCGAIGLGADVIAGFPGETEDDHLATLSLVERLPFTSLHVFPYSARPGTAAARLGAAIDGATIARRARELRELAATKAAAYIASRVGTRGDLVVIGDAYSSGPAGVSHRSALSGDYLSVSVPAAVPRRARFDGMLNFVDGTLNASPIEPLA